MNYTIRNWLLGRTRSQKRLFIAANDVLIWVISLWASIAVRLGDFTYFPTDRSLLIVFAIAPVIGVSVFYRSNLYRMVTRYVSSSGFFRLGAATSLTVLIWSLVYHLTKLPGVPRSSILIWWGFSFLLLWSSRQLASWYLLGSGAHRNEGKTVIIYGAGETGAKLIDCLQASPDLNPVALIDDNPSLQGQEILGIRVYSPDVIESLVQEFRIEELLLAIPLASLSQRRTIITRVEKLRIPVRTVPNAMELAEGKVEISDLRAVKIEDLLSRPPVPPVPELLSKNIQGKTILVTGAGGSIGSELCRQLIHNGASKLLMLDNCEFALYSISEELQCLSLTASQADEIPILVPILGSVLNESLVHSILKGHQVDTVFHAAAYKHVHLVESNVVVGVRNNVFGTFCIGEAAARYGVKSFVLVSTDKAVRPTNVMGASKRLSELTIQALGASAASETSFSCVRFGNVLASSGSVVPKFKKQIEAGGPITVTDPDVTRYFMSIPEAAQLVIQAGAMSQDGTQIFVLDMGEPVRIDDLARSMIRLMGRDVRDEDNPDGDLEIVYTGLRDGEKLHEELLIGGAPRSTQHPRIMCVDTASPDMLELQQELMKLEHALGRYDIDAIIAVLMANVDGFTTHLAPQKARDNNVIPFGGVSVA